MNFYLKNNWVAAGDYFDEDTIPQPQNKQNVMSIKHVMGIVAVSSPVPDWLIK